jgi:hydrogenase maturation protease
MANESFRTLVIGYGNPYRCDDGVAYHIINAIREKRGQRPLTPEEDGEDELGGALDTLMLHQLLPELAPLFKDYARVIFVDAHAGGIAEEVRVIPVEEDYGFQAVTHHMSPGMMLTLARQLGGAAPHGWLVSVKGTDFDFGAELSAACAQYAAEAARRIEELATPPMP